MDIYQVIVRPVVSEKSVSLQGNSKYSFLVHGSAGKDDIRQAVSQIYGVDVQGINILQQAGKSRRRGRAAATIRRQSRKKAVVTLKSGQVLDPGKIYAEHKSKDTKS